MIDIVTNNNGYKLFYRGLSEEELFSGKDELQLSNKKWREELLKTIEIYSSNFKIIREKL